MKHLLHFLITSVSLGRSAFANSAGAASSPPPPSLYPTRQIAGVTVIDTPIVRAAHDYARARSDDTLYRHVMRSWLFGALMISKNSTLQASVDIEVQAVAILLHDLGLDRTPNSTIVSPD